MEKMPMIKLGKGKSKSHVPMEQEVYLHGKKYTVIVKENPEGIIIDLYVGNKDFLYDTFTFWNDDV